MIRAQISPLRSSIIGFFIIGSPVSFVGAAHAANAQPISGTPYYCYESSSGKDELVTKDSSGDFTTADQNSAIKKLATELSQTTTDTQDLQQALNELEKKDSLSKSDLAKAQKIFNAAQSLAYIEQQYEHPPAPGTTPTPPTMTSLNYAPGKNQSPAISQLKAQIKSLNALKSSLSKHRDALENFKSKCKKGTPDFLVKTLAVEVTPTHTTVGDLYYVYDPVDSKYETPCIQIGRGANAITLGAYPLTKNPCDLDGFNCPNILPRGYLGFFHDAGVDFSTVPGVSDIDFTIEGEQDTFEPGLFICGK